MELLVRSRTSWLEEEQIPATGNPTICPLWGKVEHAAELQPSLCDPLLSFWGPLLKNGEEGEAPVVDPKFTLHAGIHILARRTTVSSLLKADVLSLSGEMLGYRPPLNQYTIYLHSQDRKRQMSENGPTGSSGSLKLLWWNQYAAHSVCCYLVETGTQTSN